MGRHPKISSVEATSIDIDDNGTVVYGEEVKLESIQNCILELPEEVESLLGIRRLTGWLIYVENLKYKNHDLVVAEVPARNLYFRSKLQPARHRKKSEVVKEFRKAIVGSGQSNPLRAISQGLSAVSFQPFESRFGAVSAWLLEPRRIGEFAITRRSFEPDKAEWSFGICRDIDRCIGLLEINEAKDRLLERIEKGYLFERYRDGQLPESRPMHRRMTDIAASFHEDVYRAAIMTAIAGIDESMYRDNPKGNARPVMKQVILLYCQFMDALVNRYYRSDCVSRTTAASSSGEIALVRVILAAPEEWPLTEKLLAWLSRHRSQFSKALETMIDERLRKPE